MITSDNKALSRGGYVREEMKFSEYIEKYKNKQEDNKLYYAAGILLPQYLPQLLDHILEPRYLKFKLMQSKSIEERRK